MKLIVFVLLFSTSLMCQEFGFAFDGVGKVTTEKAYMILPVSGINVFINGKIIPELHFETRIGYQLIFEDYRGWEASIYFLYNIYDPLYIIGGVNYHANEGSSSNSQGVIEKGLIMPGIGAGIEIFSFFSFELLYHQLLKNELISWTRQIYYTESGELNLSTKRYLKGVIKVNLKFRWHL